MTWLLVSLQCSSIKTDLKLCKISLSVTGVHDLTSDLTEKKIASGILVLFCVPISFSDNLLYDFFVKKNSKHCTMSLTFSAPFPGPKSQLNTSLCNCP